MAYKPQPIDLSGIELCAELQRDIETISQSVHEVWAANRMADGWGFATNTEHPCLVEYEALPEQEKAIDRATVTQTIKMLLHLGYEIKKRENR